MGFRPLLAATFAGATTLALTATAQAATFMSQASFNAAAGATVLIENFEDSNPLLRNQPLASYTGPGGEITFVGMDGTPFPNVYLANPPFNNFGSGLNPTTSIILTANGNEGFLATLATPTQALGFNVFLNDSPFTVTFLGSDGPQSLVYDSPPDPGNNLGFAGAVTTGTITGFRIQAVNGQNINTGVDNIVVAVPEPATWAFMIVGFGAVGYSLRSARKRKLNPATA
jgi:hypothetical protein